MNIHETIQMVLYIVVLCVLSPFIGRFMADVFEGKKTFLHPVLSPVEKLIYKVGGVKAEEESSWKGYLAGLMIFNLIGFTVQNFLSAATGIAVIIALARGIMNKSSDKLGNFWVDLTRTTLYILLPLSIIVAIALVGQGVVQTFSSYITADTIEGGKQIIPM